MAETASEDGIEELRRAVAFVFRRQGRGKLPREDVRNLVSFDLRWFKPSQAREFLDQAEAAGLLERVEMGDLEASDEGPVVQPTFDVDAVELPVPFRPDRDVLEIEVAPRAREAVIEDPDAEPTLLDDVLEALCEETGWDRERAERRVYKEVERRGDLVTNVTAALLLARSEGVDVEAWASEALEDMQGA